MNNITNYQVQLKRLISCPTAKPVNYRMVWCLSESVTKNKCRSNIILMHPACQKLYFGNRKILDLKRSFHRNSFSQNSEKQKANVSSGNVLPFRQKLKVFALALLGIHTTLWLVGKFLKKGRKDEAKAYIEEQNGRYLMPFSKDRDGLIEFNGVWLPYAMVGKKKVEDLKQFNIASDDILVVTYPKSGTTWAQEIVYLLVNKQNIAGAVQTNLNDNFPFLEFPYPGLDVIAHLPCPRMIKTHLPYELLPKSIEKSKPKIIYIARNVKDVSVSYYHFHRMWAQVAYSGTFDNFVEEFLKGRVAYGSWWQHVKSFWEKRNCKNILFITYEDLQKDPVEEIKKIAEFLNISADINEIKKIARFSSFSYMKENHGTNNNWMEVYGLINKSNDPNMQFMRKGTVGDWKKYYSKDTAAVIDGKTKEELEQLGLSLRDS